MAMSSRNKEIITWALMASRGFSGEVLVKTGTFRTEEEFWTRLVISASSLVVLCEKYFNLSMYYSSPSLLRS